MRRGLGEAYRRTLSLFFVPTSPLLVGYSSALNEVNQNYSDGHEQQQVDEPTKGVGAYQPHKPQDQQNQKYCPQHVISPCLTTASRQVLAGSWRHNFYTLGELAGQFRAAHLYGQDCSGQLGGGGAPVGADDEPLGCGAHKIEGVAGHQSEDGVIGAVQHFNVLRLNHLGSNHAIAVGSV